jgi:fluoride exporter
VFALTLLCVAAGGFVGAPTRFLCDRAVTARRGGAFPLGTMLINCSGSLLFGLLEGLTLSGHLPMLVRSLVGTGFCGAYTTFSTWSFETVRLLEGREYRRAGINAIGSVVVGLAFAAVGLAIGLAF